MIIDEIFVKISGQELLKKKLYNFEFVFINYNAVGII